MYVRGVAKFSNAYSLRPIILLNNGLRALIDTGAEPNTWHSSFTALLKIGKYNGVSDGLTNGIGGSVHGFCDFVISIEIDKLVWDNVHVRFSKHFEIRDDYDIIIGMNLFQTYDIAVSFSKRLFIIDNKVDSNLCKCSYDARGIRKENFIIDGYLCNANSGVIEPLNSDEDLTLEDLTL